MADKSQIAEAVANYLFANGWGVEADRLLLVVEDRSCSAKVSDAQYLGGWSKPAVINVVLRILESTEVD